MFSFLSFPFLRNDSIQNDRFSALSYHVTKCLNESFEFLLSSALFDRFNKPFKKSINSLFGDNDGVFALYHGEITFFAKRDRLRLMSQMIFFCTILQ